MPLHQLKNMGRHKRISIIEDLIFSNNFRTSATKDGAIWGRIINRTLFPNQQSK